MTTIQILHTCSGRKRLILKKIFIPKDLYQKRPNNMEVIEHKKYGSQIQKLSEKHRVTHGINQNFPTDYKKAIIVR